MKPNDVIIDTDFYQLASDGYVEVPIDVAINDVGIGTAEKGFNVGSAGADFIVLSYDSLSGKWGAGAARASYTDKEVTVIRVIRESENHYKLKATVQYAQPSTTVQVKARVKTFFWPEA